jgi:hypothetical protein
MCGCMCICAHVCVCVCVPTIGWRCGRHALPELASHGVVKVCGVRGHVHVAIEQRGRRTAVQLCPKGLQLLCHSLPHRLFAPRLPPHPPPPTHTRTHRTPYTMPRPLSLEPGRVGVFLSAWGAWWRRGPQGADCGVLPQRSRRPSPSPTGPPRRYSWPRHRCRGLLLLLLLLLLRPRPTPLAGPHAPARAGPARAPHSVPSPYHTHRQTETDRQTDRHMCA